MLKILEIKDIVRIYKNNDELKGYYIEFDKNRKIHITKRRTIIALLVLIHKSEGTESDLAQGNTTINEIKSILGSKLEEEIIADFYGDANKPYSELWNEEGFTFIDNLKGGRNRMSQKYTLKKSDHFKLFDVAKKAYRKAPTTQQKEEIRQKQNGKCNFCGSNIVIKSALKPNTYSKDRRREVFDHRHPVEKGGDSLINNFQALCFYCNKSKWQICTICQIPNCDAKCALRNPENSKVISPTQENISDVLADRDKFEN